MVIGTSDGKMYENDLDYQMGNHIQMEETPTSTTKPVKEAGLVSDMFNWVMGESKSPPVTDAIAKPMEHYPSDDDVKFARDAGFFNDVYAPWTEGKIARTIKDYYGKDLDELTDEKSSQIVKSNPGLAEVYAKAALASNRIPLAAVGFNPDKTALIDSQDKFNLGGAYTPSKDRMFAVAGSTSSIVHESMHRGMNELRTKYPKETGEIYKSLPNEEMVVRYLMATQAGNPEEGRGKAGDEQIKQANWNFEKSSLSERNKKALEDLTRLSERFIKEQKPGGHSR